MLANKRIFFFKIKHNENNGPDGGSCYISKKTGRKRKQKWDLCLCVHMQVCFMFMRTHAGQMCCRDVEEKEEKQKKGTPKMHSIIYCPITEFLEKRKGQYWICTNFFSILLYPSSFIFDSNSCWCMFWPFLVCWMHPFYTFFSYMHQKNVYVQVSKFFRKKCNSPFT